MPPSGERLAPLDLDHPHRPGGRRRREAAHARQGSRRLDRHRRPRHRGLLHRHLAGPRAPHLRPRRDRGHPHVPRGGPDPARPLPPPPPETRMIPQGQPQTLARRLLGLLAGWVCCVSLVATVEGYLRQAPLPVPSAWVTPGAALLAAMAGGYLCAFIAKDRTMPRVL